MPSRHVRWTLNANTVLHGPAHSNSYVQSRRDSGPVPFLIWAHQQLFPPYRYYNPQLLHQRALPIIPHSLLLPAPCSDPKRRRLLEEQQGRLPKHFGSQSRTPRTLPPINETRRRDYEAPGTEQEQAQALEQAQQQEQLRAKEPAKEQLQMERGGQVEGVEQQGHESLINNKRTRHMDNHRQRSG